MKEVKYYNKDLEFLETIYNESRLWLEEHLYMKDTIDFKLIAYCHILSSEKIIELRNDRT